MLTTVPSIPMGSVGGPAAVLLTGGSSTRLGTDKAALVVDGETLAQRLVRVLRDAGCDPVVEVGPGYADAAVVREDPPGAGPLAAVARAHEELRSRGVTGDAIVLAVDLPNVEAPLVRWLAEQPPGAAVVPMVAGRAQPLCARYAATTLDTARALVDQGERSMRTLLDRVEVTYVDETAWGGVCAAGAFLDVDTPDDAARAGIETGRQ